MSLRQVYTVCVGMAIIARLRVVNAVRSSCCFFAARGPLCGSGRAIHAYRLHANDAITMKAQLLSSASMGAAGARMSVLRWAKLFS